MLNLEYLKSNEYKGSNDFLHKAVGIPAAFIIFAVPNWKVGRVVDGGSLENCWAATSRGFESLTFRKEAKKSVPSLLEHRFFLTLCIAPPQAGRDSATEGSGIPEGEGLCAWALPLSYPGTSGAFCPRTFGIPEGEGLPKFPAPTQPHAVTNQMRSGAQATWRTRGRRTRDTAPLNHRRPVRARCHLYTG